MLEFIGKLFRGEEDASKRVAKERLRLVLVQDRMSLSPQALNAMKEELIAVISKYLEIDEAGPEVSLERDGESVALVATIPVKRVTGLARAGR
ncbi:MAG: cell division topological specificity factor MinE [Firmicutes bacterium]|nr:cell division topological specificity factor MinE [Bacillota bacterium]